MDESVVPGAKTVLGVAEVGQALPGAVRAQPVPQPDQANGQVGHGPGQVAAEQPAAAAHDERVGLVHWYLGSGRQPVQPGQPFRAAPDYGQAQGQYVQGLEPGRLASGAAGAGGECPLAPDEGLIGPSGGAEIESQAICHVRAYERLGGGIVSPPGLKEMSLDHRPPA